MNPESKQYWHTFRPDFLQCVTPNESSIDAFDLNVYFDSLNEKYKNTDTFTSYKMMRSVIISECMNNGTSTNAYIPYMDKGALLAIECSNHTGMKLSDEQLGFEMKLFMKDLGSEINGQSTQIPITDLAALLGEYAEQGADMMGPRYDDIINHLCNNSFDHSGFMRLGFGYVLHHYIDACEEQSRLFSTFTTDQMETAFDTDPHEINRRIAEYFRTLE